MLSDEVFELMQKTMIGNSKIVLIGDIYQLAPIKNTSQKKHTVPVMEGLLHKVPTIVMTTVMRHEGTILKASSAFRKTVETGIFKKALLAKDVIHVAGADFRDKIEEAFLSNTYSPDTAKILCFTNERVQEYNKYIRNLKGDAERFQAGEIVITNNPIIQKGEYFTVDSEVTVTAIGKEDTILGVPGYYLTLNDSIDAFLPDNYDQAKKLMIGLTYKAKAAKAAKDYTGSKKIWTTYFDIKENWLDLRSQFASTVHKSQGSSYDEVFIDLDDIGECKAAYDTARMLYVAISRARKKVIMSGTLPDKYKG
jgi:hypothetical protein